MCEIWKDILDYEGYYKVSNYGRVMSVKRKYRPKEIILKQARNKDGYMLVGLRKDGIIHSYYVHRLVYEAFNGSLPSEMHINHINEDKSDNRLENLNAMSQQDNNSWGTRNERIRQSNVKNNGTKVAQFTKDGKFIKIWPAQKEVERALGICSTSICKCCNNKKWAKTAGGYRWERVFE